MLFSPAMGSGLEQMRSQIQGQGFHVVPTNSQNSGIISAGQARQIAENRYGGKALSVQLDRTLKAYRVKLIKAGRVRIVTIDAKSRTQ